MSKVGSWYRGITTVLLVGGLSVGFWSFAPDPLTAQIPTGFENGSPPRPAVFLDCQGGPNCNRSQFRTEITFVNWVRDREDSDIHLIFTSQGMSGGNRQYTLDFVGRGEFAGLDEHLTFQSSGQDVQAETMDGLARTMRLGLVRYALAAGLGPDLDVRFTGDAARVEDESEGNGDTFYDPWNSWTFRVAVSGDMDFEETQTSSRLNPQFNADRVTEAWKLNLSSRLDIQRERRDLADGREVRDDRNDWRFSALIVHSIGGHMGIGIDTDLRNSVRRNQTARIRLSPAIEYNYYPYSEATRRQFIAHYSVGVEHSNYMEETVFGVDRETLPVHRVGVQYRAREQWGNAGVGVDANQYLHSGGEFYSFGVSGNLSYRILRGLELNFSAGASRVNDNLYTPAGEISDEDILLGRQRLPSGYEYDASLGLSYRWGSSFANIVNNRFPRSVRW
ncbi:MAG: hypothetical protein U5R14_15470 [Gemmatimonadota bacterium]|nr:hypothetical protein [Gemmatimonadota bacterium]